MTILNFILDATSSSSGILPATRARLVSLKDFGAKKIETSRFRYYRGHRQILGYILDIIERCTGEICSSDTFIL